ncbi:hypothetical protein ACHAQJ_008465 [Trichoderma viride]
MKFFASFIAVVTVFASAEACQCLSSEGVNVASTFNCCREAGGNPGGDQCPANQISQRLSSFAECCKSYGDLSDCRCPKGCARAELQAIHETQGKAPPTDAEVDTLLAKYAD